MQKNAITALRVAVVGDSLRSHNGLTVTKMPEKGRRQIYSAKYSDFVVVQSPKM